MKLTNQIIIILILCTCSVRVRAQLYRYLNDNSKLDSASEGLLDKEACSMITRSEVVYSDTFSYPIRTYCIRALDGADNKVTIFERPFSFTLHIECPNDSLKIADFNGLIKVHFLRSDLLEIVFIPRGGSDEGHEDVLILALNKGKFCVVMALETVDEYEMAYEYRLHSVRLNLHGQNLRNCQLKVNVQELFKSRDNPSRNFDRHNQYILKFDERQKVFYNQVRHLNGVFKIVDYSHPGKKLVAGDYPVINLGKDKYCYIDNNWYLLGDTIREKRSIWFAVPSLSFK